MTRPEDRGNEVKILDMTDCDQELLDTISQSLDMMDYGIPRVEEEAREDICIIRKFLSEIIQKPQNIEGTKFHQAGKKRDGFESHIETFLLLENGEGDKRIFLSFELLNLWNNEADHFLLREEQKYNKYLEEIRTSQDFMQKDMSRATKQDKNGDPYFNKSVRHQKIADKYTYSPLETVTFGIVDPKKESSYIFQIGDTFGGPFAVVADYNSKSKKERFLTKVPISLGERWNSEIFKKVSKELLKKSCRIYFER